MPKKYICYKCYSVGKYRKHRDSYGRLVCQCGRKTFFSAN